MDSNELLEQIHLHFDRPVPPDVKDREVDYNSEFWEETSEFWGKAWAQLTIEQFYDHQYCLIFFPPDDLPYFLGCFMTFCLQNGDFDSDTMDLFLITQPNLNKLKQHEVNRFKLFRSSLSTQQFEALTQFFLYRDKVLGLTGTGSGAHFLKAIEVAGAKQA